MTDTCFDIYLIFELGQFLGKYNIAIIVNWKLLGKFFLLQLFSFFKILSLFSNFLCFLRLENPFSENCQEVEEPHAKHAAPEPSHADQNGLKR